MDLDTTVELHRESAVRLRKRARDRDSHVDESGRSHHCDPRDKTHNEEVKKETEQYVLHLVAQPSASSSPSPPPPPSSSSSAGGSVEAVTESPAMVVFGLEGTRVGRDPSCCDVVLTSGSISRLHTVLSVVGEDVCVHDKSHNGTFINGRLVGRGRCAILRDGDMVSFVNPLLPEVRRFSYTLEVPPRMRLVSTSGGAGNGATAAGPFASLQRAGMAQYALGPSIGQGSFAVVRLGVNRLTNEKVAVKILEKHRFASEDAFTSLHMEMEMMLTEHPNVVRVLDAFEAPDTVALVMEYVRGGDLFDYVVGRGRNPFTEEEAKHLFVQLLEAVIYIHSRRIVHCDIKPENVLVDILSRDSASLTPNPSATTPPLDGAEGADGVVPISAFSVLDNHQDDARAVSPFNVCLKLTDFGVAKYYGDTHAQDEDVDDRDGNSNDDGGGGGVGTARYAAPEQLRCGRSDGGAEEVAALTAAVDIWALGVLLYVMCAGGLPKNPQQDATVKFSKHMAGLSGDCKSLIQAMMELDPERRIRLRDICAHPWLADATITGRDLCATIDDDDVMSVTTILSPRFGRSVRPSAALPDTLSASGRGSLHVRATSPNCQHSHFP